MQDGASVSSAGRELERASNGATRGMAATRVALSGVRRAQNPAYRPALWDSKRKPASVMTPAFFRVRPAWAQSWRCESSRELTTANEAKRNCVRVTERGEEAWSEAASRWTRTG